MGDRPLRGKPFQLIVALLVCAAAWALPVPALIPPVSSYQGSNASPDAGSFKPFELKTLDGEMRRLDDFLARATLVTFFFPT